MKINLTIDGLHFRNFGISSVKRKHPLVFPLEGELLLVEMWMTVSLNCVYGCIVQLIILCPCLSFRFQRLAELAIDYLVCFLIFYFILQPCFPFSFLDLQLCWSRSLSGNLTDLTSTNIHGLFYFCTITRKSFDCITEGKLLIKLKCGGV